MSDSSLAKLYYSEESTWAETPSTPTMTYARFVSESLGQATTTTRSAEIDPGGQDTDIVRTGIEASGDIGIELSYGAFDTFFEHGFRSGFNTLTTPADDLTKATANTITRATGSFVTDGFVAGGKYHFTGFPSNIDDGWLTVTAVVALTLTIEETMTTGAASTVVVKGDDLINGVTKKSMLIEKHLPVTSGDEYVSFRGMRTSGLNLAIAPGSIVTGSFNFLGERAYPSGSALDASPTAADTKSVLNAIDNISDIREGGAAATFVTTNIALSIDGALRGQPAVGVLGNAGIGIGTIGVSGTLEAYFESRTEYEKYTDYTTSDLSFVTGDAAGNAYAWYLPSIKYTDGQVVVGGKDGDVLVSLQFSAFKDATYGYTVGCFRKAA